MKHLLRPLVSLCLPLLISSCEKGVFDPQPTANCLEVRQEDEAGRAIEKVYDGKKITEYRSYAEGQLQYYYTFTYNSEGRITGNQYVNAQSTAQFPLEQITYNEQGKWTTANITYASGDGRTLAATYNDKGQITELTSTVTRAGTSTINYTITYAWEGDNNTRRTYTSPTQQTVTRYEFDLDHENKRRKEQEKIAFLTTAVLHNANVLKRVVTTSTTGTTTTEAAYNYEYEFNEDGFPYRVSRFVNGGAYPEDVTSFTYDNCE